MPGLDTKVIGVSTTAVLHDTSCHDPSPNRTTKDSSEVEHRVTRRQLAPLAHPRGIHIRQRVRAQKEHTTQKHGRTSNLRNPTILAVHGVPVGNEGLHVDLHEQRRHRAGQLTSRRLGDSVAEGLSTTRLRLRARRGSDLQCSNMVR